MTNQERAEQLDIGMTDDAAKILARVVADLVRLFRLSPRGKHALMLLQQFTDAYRLGVRDERERSQPLAAAEQRGESRGKEEKAIAHGNQHAEWHYDGNCPRCRAKPTPPADAGPA